MHAASEYACTDTVTSMTAASVARLIHARGQTYESDAPKASDTASASPPNVNAALCQQPVPLIIIETLFCVVTCGEIELIVLSGRV